MDWNHLVHELILEEILISIFWAHNQFMDKTIILFQEDQSMD
jgi:hypothetical protein